MNYEMIDRIEILIADDHPLVRMGLRQVIEKESAFIVIGEAGDGKAAYAAIAEHKPQIAILDLEMPLMTGLDVARRVMKEKLPTSIIILTMYDEEAMFQEAMEIGVLGYLLKDSVSMDVMRCIHMVIQGEYFISPALSGYAMKNKRTDTTDPNKRAGLFLLTPSERRILKLVGENRTSIEIAEELAISPKTVDNHRTNICQKLKLSGTNALLRFALTHRNQL